MTIGLVHPPPQGIWRIGRGPNPLELRPPLPPDDLDIPKVGNRFDSPLGTYRVGYFGRTLEVCFGETLARFRPNLDLIALIEDEWEQMGFMKPGGVPKEWRQRRVAARVKIVSPLRFVDLESAKTLEVLRGRLATQLIVLGHTDLDLALTKGKDRRVTRLISNWIFSQTDPSGNPLYGGIRYLSRLDSKWECWAVFHDVEMEELLRLQILRNDPHLRKVAQIYGLTIF